MPTESDAAEGTVFLAEPLRSTSSTFRNSMGWLSAWSAMCPSVRSSPSGSGKPSGTRSRSLGSRSRESAIHAHRSASGISFDGEVGPDGDIIINRWDEPLILRSGEHTLIRPALEADEPWLFSPIRAGRFAVATGDPEDGASSVTLYALDER